MSTKSKKIREIKRSVMDVMAKIRNFEGCGSFWQEADSSNTSNDGEKRQRENVKKKTIAMEQHDRKEMKG